MNKRMKIDEQTTSADMDHLWGAVHAARDKTTHVKVDKAVLTRLLLDHGHLLDYYHRGL